MPAGSLVIVPRPAPPVITVSVTSGSGSGLGSKLAERFAGSVRVSVQLAVPEHPPPVHPVKTDLSSATAVRLTWPSASKSAAHTSPQVMPSGSLVIVPPPSPVRCTTSPMGAGAGGSSLEDAVAT